MEKQKDPYKPDQQTEYFQSPKWIRVFLGGKCIANSKNVLLIRGAGHLPIYYFPKKDVKLEFLSQAESGDKNKSVWTIRVGETVREHGGWSYANQSEIKDHIAFHWDKMDAWFEEDEQVYVHARDPFKRLDTIASSRSLHVDINGQTIAQTERPVLLFETALPARFYIPKLDCRLDLLVPSSKQTRCPYKGTASHYSVKAGDKLIEDIVWTYPFPTPEMSKIKGLLCFYHEKLDEFYVDGEKLAKVKTPWS